MFTTSLPDIIVQATMPVVIINTETYLERVYFFFKIIIPIIILAIREP